MWGKKEEQKENGKKSKRKQEGKKEREKEKNFLVATVEQGVFSRDQFYFWNMLLSGRGQHLLPLFSIIQNKY